MEGLGVSSSGSDSGTLSCASDFDEEDSLGSRVAPGVGTSETNSAVVDGLIASMLRQPDCRKYIQPKSSMRCAHASVVNGQSSEALEAVSTVQTQYQVLADAYKKAKQLRSRVAQARNSNSYKKASQLLHHKCSSNQHHSGVHVRQHHRVHLAASASSQQLAKNPPSLPALTTVVKMLLQLTAMQAGPVTASALRRQLLQNMKAAASAARQAGHPFSVAGALHQALPALRAAVRQACKNTQAAAAAAAMPAADLFMADSSSSTSSSPRDAAAAIEAALTQAACEVQLECLMISPASSQAAAAAAAGSRSSSGISESELDALMQEELAAALSRNAVNLH